MREREILILSSFLVLILEKAEINKWADKVVTTERTWPFEVCQSACVRECIVHLDLVGRQGVFNALLLVPDK